MIAAITYANEQYKKHKKLNTKTARLFGKVDKVYSFSPTDIDKEFYKENKNILSQPCGNGLWLWKPYFIDKVMNELTDGDFICYADAGSFYMRNVHGLVTKLKESNQDIMLFNIPLIECQWTKKTIFYELDAYTKPICFSNQIMANIVIANVCKNSREFIKKWLKLCQNEVLIMPEKECESENEWYIAHREDQSILSILAKKEGIIPFSDPTDYGKFPMQYLAYDRLFKMSKKQKKYQLGKTYFILTRSANPILYFLKFCMKSVLKKLNLIVRK